jgi:hypothetical protein
MWYKWIRNANDRTTVIEIRVMIDNLKVRIDICNISECTNCTLDII